MAEELTDRDIVRLEAYVRDARRKKAMGEAIARDDFMAWLRHAAAWLLDRLEAAWRWVRRVLGLD
jgi:hypothetical protein